MIAWRTLRLVLIVCAISTLGALMKHLRMTNRLVSGIENISGSIKVTMVLIPALIGLMPMPGGALLSAPLVEATAENQTISDAKKAAINFWFRHIFEFCWPIFPGLILAAAILKIDLGQLCLLQIPLTLAMLLGGLIFLIFPLRGIDKYPRDRTARECWLDALAGIWPIMTVVIITFVFSIDLLISLAIAFTLFLAVIRPRIGLILRSVKEGSSFSIVSLMFGIMVFQRIIEDSGAAVDLANQIASWGVPNWLVISLSCALIGFIAGIVTAYVGVVYPILVPLLIVPEPDFADIILAHASGLIAVMISPLHLCLILTKEYFKTSFAKIYPLILGPALFVTLVLILLLMFGYGS
jgi:integral membrane protein (TIGR00529 family)